MLIDLSGRIALVTGATGELGRVMVRSLALSGADLVIHYHQNAARAEALAGEVKLLGRRALCLQADTGDEASVAAMRQRVQQAQLSPDILVINAVAQIHPWSTILEETIADYESQFRTCVLQSVLLGKAFLPHMQARKWGRVIGINTECTMQLFEKYSAYVAGKRGMDGVLRVMAREVGPDNITVNQIAPGWTRSEKDETQVADDAAYVQGVPLRRRGSDQEIANVVTFLASDQASYISGAFVPVCGGNVMPTV